MEPVWIVFLVSSLLSFFPIYRVLSRFTTAKQLGRSRKPASKLARHDARQQFLQCLRNEAIARVQTALLEAAAEQARTGEVAGARAGQDAMRRLEEVRGTVQALFSRDAIAAFDRAVAALKSGLPQAASVAHVMSALEAQSSG
ncbi:MAG: hypothetical protein ACKVP7_10015 [Hyphomicrobiaceae bacterium]